MLSESIISRIASDYGLNAEDFKAKIASEKEEELELKEGEFFTDSDLESRDRNTYNEAKKASEEMSVKDLKKKFGYDFEGKSFDRLFEHHNEELKGKYSKGTSERIKELEEDLKKVNQTRETETSGLSEQLKAAMSQNTMLGLQKRLLSQMPETTIDKNDVLDLFTLKCKVNKDENGKIYFNDANGNPLKDEKTQGYLDESTVFTNFVEPYIKKTPGRGEGNNFGDGPATDKMTFIDQWEKSNGKSISSPEGVQAYQAYRTEQAKS